MRDRKIDFKEAYYDHLPKHRQRAARSLFTDKPHHVVDEDDLSFIIEMLDSIIGYATYKCGGCALKEPIAPSDFAWFDGQDNYIFSLNVPNTNPDFSDKPSIRVNLLPITFDEIRVLIRARQTLMSYAIMLDHLKKLVALLGLHCEMKPAKIDEVVDGFEERLREYISDCFAEEN